MNKNNKFDQYIKDYENERLKDKEAAFKFLNKIDKKYLLTTKRAELNELKQIIKKANEKDNKIYDRVRETKINIDDYTQEINKLWDKIKGLKTESSIKKNKDKIKEIRKNLQNEKTKLKYNMSSLQKQEDNINKINLSINPKIKNIEDIIKEVNNFIKDEKKNKNYISKLMNENKLKTMYDEEYKLNFDKRDEIDKSTVLFEDTFKSYVNYKFKVEADNINDFVDEIINLANKYFYDEGINLMKIKLLFTYYHNGKFVNTFREIEGEELLKENVDIKENLIEILEGMEQGGTYESLSTYTSLSGSDPVAEDGAKLNINYVEMRGHKQGKAGNKKTKLNLCSEITLKPSGINTCIKDSLIYYGFEVNEDNEYIYKNGLKYLINKHKSTNTKYIIYLDSPNAYIDFKNRNFKVIDLVYNGRKAPFKRLEFEQLYILHWNLNEEERKNRNNIECFKYIYDNEHIAPLKDINNEIDYFYMDNRLNIYIMKDEQLTLITHSIEKNDIINKLSINTQNEISRATTAITYKIIAFDFETIIDFDNNNIICPYSVSWSYMTLQYWLNQGNYTKIYNTDNDKGYFYYGFDCVEVFLKEIQKITSNCLCVLTGWNNSRFDNYFLIEPLINLDMFNNIFFSKSQILNIKFGGSSAYAGRHCTFDLCQLVKDSLKSACENFQIKNAKIDLWGDSKEEFFLIQWHYNEHKNLNSYFHNKDCKYIEFSTIENNKINNRCECKKYNDLKTYNIYDVLACQEIYEKLDIALQEPLNKLNIQLFDNKTIGSFIYKLFNQDVEYYNLYDKYNINIKINNNDYVKTINYNDIDNPKYINFNLTEDIKLNDKEKREIYLKSKVDLMNEQKLKKVNKTIEEGGKPQLPLMNIAKYKKIRSSLFAGRTQFYPLESMRERQIYNRYYINKIKQEKGKNYKDYYYYDMDNLNVYYIYDVKWLYPYCM
jgi:hypothetical protein